MIFIEFTLSDKCTKDYFVGASYNDVMTDTQNGTEFGSNSYSSHREITEEEARSLKLGFLDEGIEAIQRGCKNFYLNRPI
jgi:hypothetical protein